MDRRDTVFALFALGTAPLASLAQQARKSVPRLGVLLFGTPDTDPNLGAFHKGLRSLGYEEPKNIVIEYRYASGKPERLPELAAALVAAAPDIIFVLGGDVAPFARAATSTIPIVMAVSVDPAQSGLVASLARPGGNITGVTWVSSDIAAKRLQLLKEAAPRLSRVGVIWNPDHADPEYRETRKAAQSMGVKIQSLEVRNADDFEAAFQSAVRESAEAVIVISSRLMIVNRKRILDFSAKHGVLLVSGWGPWAREGALFSYGADLDLHSRRAASYVDRILKGAKPSELPVERPTKFDLVINLRTARTLGIKIPQSLLVRADEVIQ